MENDNNDKLKKKNRRKNILEVEFEDNNVSLNAKSVLEKYNIKIKVVENNVLISDINIFDKLPDILKTLKDASLKVCEMKLRENTLEDIFINLTGRRLREWKF